MSIGSFPFYCKKDGHDDDDDNVQENTGEIDWTNDKRSHCINSKHHSQNESNQPHHENEEAHQNDGNIDSAEHHKWSQHFFE